MKTTADVGRDLDLHPANLILYMCGLGAAFEQVWPTCEADWVATLKSTHWERFGEKARVSDEGTQVRPPAHECALSDTARRILTKMAAKRNYGTSTVSFDTVKKHYAVGSDDAEEAIEDLIRRGLLQTDDRRGPYRLNPGRTGEIDRLTTGRP